MTQSQPGQKVHKTLSRNNPSHKRADRVAQGIGSEFNPQYHTHKKKTQKNHMRSIFITWKCQDLMFMFYLRSF
jgi:ribosomal protein L44E